MSELSEESHGKLDVKRKSRGIAYKLKMFWACEILELAMSPATVRLEPDRLASSEKRNRTTTVRLNRTTTVRCEPDYHSPPNTTEETKDTGEGTEGSNLGVCTRGFPLQLRHGNEGHMTKRSGLVQPARRPSLLEDRSRFAPSTRDRIFRRRAMFSASISSVR